MPYARRAYKPRTTTTRRTTTTTRRRAYVNKKRGLTALKKRQVRRIARNVAGETKYRFANALYDNQFRTAGWANSPGPNGTTAVLSQFEGLNQIPISRSCPIFFNLHQFENEHSNLRRYIPPSSLTSAGNPMDEWDGKKQLCKWIKIRVKFNTSAPNTMLRVLLVKPFTGQFALEDFIGAAETTFVDPLKYRVVKSWKIFLNPKEQYSPVNLANEVTQDYHKPTDGTLPVGPQGFATWQESHSASRLFETFIPINRMLYKPRLDGYVPMHKDLMMVITCNDAHATTDDVHHTTASIFTQMKFLDYE